MSIRGFAKILINDSDLKKEIPSDFEEIILPWWEGEVVGHLVGGSPRGFSIYLKINIIAKITV